MLNVAYELECSQCPVEYVREIGERFRTLTRDLKRVIGGHEMTSKVPGHAAARGHTFDFGNARVIYMDRSKGGLLLR